MREEVKKLLELRKKIKAKKPEFLRHLWWKKPSFKNDPKWRRPKGIDNKMRRKLKGYPPLVSVGYGGPSEARGLHPSGYEPVVVEHVGQLDSLDPKKHILYIGSSVGLKKRIEIYKIATARGFKVANPLPEVGGRGE